MKKICLSEYTDFGFSIFPVEKNGKKPLIKWTEFQDKKASLDQIRNWSILYSNPNWAIVTGEISGIVVVDIDDLEKYYESGIIFPDTPTVRTSKGLHLYFKHPGIIIPNSAKNKGWFDIRGDGGYVVAPPSFHQSGVQYLWADGKSPKECDFATLPQWIIDEIIKVPIAISKSIHPTNSRNELDELLSKGALEGSRNDAATRLAGLLFGKKHSRLAVITIMNDWNQKNDPPLDDQELLAVIDSIESRENVKNSKQYVLDTPWIRSYINSEGKEVYEKDSFKHTLLAEEIQNELPLYRNGKSIWYYDAKDGIYKSGAEDKIKLIIAEKLGIYANNNRVSETFNHVIRTTPVDSGALPFEKKYPHILNLQNGTFDINEQKFSSTFSPDYYHHLKIPITYNPLATCNEINKFIEEVAYKEDVPFIHELAASMLIKKPITPALVFLLGNGGNGKSQLIKLFTMLVGQENTSSIPLATLQNDRFASAELYMKLLNSCGDIGDGFLPQTDVLKSATGGDAIYAQHKGKDPFKFVPFAPHIYSANSEPRFRDFSKGFYDRIYPIRMDKTFRGTNSEKSDPLRMIDQNQLSGWFNKLMPICYRLITNQPRFTVSEGMRKKREEWFNKLDLIGMFIEECCIIHKPGETKFEDLVVSKQELWNSLLDWSTLNGYSSNYINRNDLERRLMQLGIREGKKRIYLGRNPQHCFIGITLKDLNSPI